MALNKTNLATTFKATFKQAKDEAWDSDRVADALADAIDAYTKTADVVGVTVSVVDTSNHPLGTGTQTGTGKLQ
jgi:hypothetical protein